PGSERGGRHPAGGRRCLGRWGDCGAGADGPAAAAAGRAGVGRVVAAGGRARARMGVVGLALAFAAFGSPSLGHLLFLAAFVLLVVESLVWQMLLPKLARDFDKVMR